MSAPLTGKFQDHYQVLGVDSKADLAAIERAFHQLSARFDPSNKETGNPEKLQAVTQAYEVLADPDLRKAFDNLRGGSGAETKPAFSGARFFETLGTESTRRLAILCILYDRRLKKPSAPGLSLRQLEGMIYATPDQLQFAMWYLKQRGHVASDDKSNVAITFAGIDYLENNIPEAEPILAILKPGCMEGAPAAGPPAKEASEPAPSRNRPPDTSGDLASLAAAMGEAPEPAGAGAPKSSLAAVSKPAPAAAPAGASQIHGGPRAAHPVRRVISIPPRNPNAAPKPGESR